MGKDYERTFDSMRVDGNRITLTGKTWVKDKDAHCCPSAAATATFEFGKHSMVELLSEKK